MSESQIDTELSESIHSESDRSEDESPTQSDIEFIDTSKEMTPLQVAEYIAELEDLVHLQQQETRYWKKQYEKLAKFSTKRKRSESPVPMIARQES